MAKGGVLDDLLQPHVAQARLEAQPLVALDHGRTAKF